MARTVAGLFPDKTTAERAVADLEEAGFAKWDIELITSEPEQLAPPTPERTAKSIAGAALGSLVVGTIGAIVAWVVAASFVPSSAAQAFAVVTVSCVGGTVGWLIGGLVYPGEPVEEREWYRERVEHEEAVILVDAHGRELEARQMLVRDGAQDLPVPSRMRGPSTGLRWGRRQSSDAELELEDRRDTAMT